MVNPEQLIEFASDDKISQHQNLVDDLIENIFDIDWAYLTDESTISDFACHFDDYYNTDMANFRQKIIDRYDVDINHLKDKYIITLIDAILSAGKYQL